MPWFFIIFLVIPVLEIWVLIEVGSIVGGLSTILLVLLTAMIGVTMLRRQGISTLLRFNQRLASGELPAQELLSGVFLLIAGAFLLTPGFVTDSIGFFLLTPQIRDPLASYLVKKGILKAVHGYGQQPYGGSFQGGMGGNTGGSNDYDYKGNVYEGTAREADSSASDDNPKLNSSKDSPIENNAHKD